MPAEIREMTVKYHATAKSSIIWLAISLMLYAVAINYAQSAYLNPIWGYYGFTFSYSELDYRQFTLIIVLMGLCAATFPTHFSKASESKFFQLKDICRSVGGYFTLLWHNSQFESAAERALYHAILSK